MDCSIALCRYLPGSGPILLDDVSCSSYLQEQHILQCSNEGIGVSNCDHGEDIAVECCEFAVILVQKYACMCVYVCVRSGNI